MEFEPVTYEFKNIKQEYFVWNRSPRLFISSINVLIGT